MSREAKKNRGLVETRHGLQFGWPGAKPSLRNSKTFGDKHDFRLKKKLKRRFAENMSQQLPQYVKTNFGAGNNLPCYKEKSNCRKYITVNIHKTYDEFSILLTWMISDALPTKATPGLPTSDPNLNGLTIDLSLLWSHHSAPWDLKKNPPLDDFQLWESAMGAAGSREDYPDRQVVYYVDKAFEQLLKFGIPYLDNKADRTGL